MLNIPQIVYEGIIAERESTTLHPSGCTRESCILQEMYRVHGYMSNVDRDPANIWTLTRFGTYEDYIIKGLSRKGELIQAQYELKDGPWSGRVDAVVADGLVEVKSTTGGNIRKGRTPYPHHIDQLHVYWELNLRQEEPLAIENAYLVYIERWDDGKIPELAQYNVVPNDTDLSTVRQRMKLWEEWAESEVLPPIPYESYDEHRWNCYAWDWKNKRYEIRCPYFHLCWPGVMEDSPF